MLSKGDISLIKRVVLFFRIIVILLLIVGCGNAKKPTGGPKDVINPKIVDFSPSEFQEINNTTIEIVFSKPIKRNTILTGMSIYPPIESKKLSWDRTILKIEITEKLQKDTNYFFTFNQKIIGEHDNPLDKSYTLVYKSGILQENTILGNFIFSNEKDVELPIKTTLSSYDSIKIFEKEMISSNFSFNFLNPDTLIFQAFIDKNENERYDYSKEPFFREIIYTKLNIPLNAELVYQDTIKPDLKKLQFVSSTELVATFSESISEFTEPKIVTIDSLNPQELKVLATDFNENDELVIITSPTDTLDYEFSFDAIYDNANNITTDIVTRFSGKTFKDSLAPEIISLHPVAGKIITTKRPEIKVTFSKIIFPNDIKIELVNSESGEVVELESNTKASFSHIFYPKNPLINYNSYEIKILQNTSDINGNQLEEDEINKFMVIFSE